jgi:hypothetical protein
MLQVLDLRDNNIGKQGARIMMRKLIIRSKPQAEFVQAAGRLAKGVGGSVKTVAGSKKSNGGNDDPTHSKLHGISGLPVRKIWRAIDLVKRARLAAIARGNFAVCTDAFSLVLGCFDGPETKASKRALKKVRKLASAKHTEQNAAMMKAQEQKDILKAVVASTTRRSSLWSMAGKRNSLIGGWGIGGGGGRGAKKKPKKESKSDEKDRLIGDGGSASQSIVYSPLKQHSDWISELCLTNCHLHDVEVELLAAFVKDLELRVLDLRGNPYGFEGAISIVKALGRKEMVREVTGRDLFIRYEGDHDMYGKYFPCLDHDPYFRKVSRPEEGDVFLDSATYDLENNMVLEELCGLPIKQMRDKKVHKLDMSAPKKGMELGEGGAVFAAKVLQIYGKVISQVNMAEASLGGIAIAEEEEDGTGHHNHGDDALIADPRQNRRMAENKAHKLAAALAGRSSRGLLMLGHLLIQWPWGELRTANLKDNHILPRAKANLMLHQKQLKLMKKDGADGESTEYLIRC